MTSPVEIIEYGWTYWLIARPRPEAPATYFGALQTETGTVITRPEPQRRLVYENQLGRDGWLFDGRWERTNSRGFAVDLSKPAPDSLHWLKSKVGQEFAEFADYADHCYEVDSCRIRRRLHRTD